MRARPPARRRAAGLLVAVLAVAPLTACTDVADVADDADDAAARTPALPTPGCTGLCLQPDPVVLGAVLPLTGPLAGLGAAQRTGLERAVAAAGDGVDVGGERREVVLEVADDRSSGDLAGQLAWSLVLGRTRVTALLVPCAPARTVLSLAEVREVPLVTGCGPVPATGAPEPPSWAFSTGPSDEARAAAVLGALPPGRLALLLSPGHDAAAWQAAAAADGTPVAGSWTVEPDAGWAAAARGLRAAGADLVVASTSPGEGARAWRTLAAAGVGLRGGWASDAALLPDWPSAAGPLGDGVLADAVGGGPGAVRALEQAGGRVARTALAALEAAGDDRRRAVAAALPAAGAPPAGREQAPVALAVWRDGQLVPLP